jgi:hypothetical protein
MGGSMGDGELAELRAAGAGCFLHKPFRLPEAARVMQALAGGA